MEIDLQDRGVLGQDGKPVDRAREYLKCKLSPLYFIENYCAVPVAGGMIPIRESELWQSSPKYRQFIKAIHEFDAVEMMASRQHGKTTTALLYYLWAMLFYPKLQIEYVTLDSKRATDAIKRMKEMLAYLPTWLQVPFKGKSEKVTYMELENGSRMNSNYVSGSIDPDKLGRGMSAPLIYIDETAFIPKADTVWTAMQPAISAARVFAKKNGYPNGILFTTTPNGAGTNFFYNVWSNGWDSTEIFTGDSLEVIPDAAEKLNSDDHKNNFIKFKIHWSETNKDEPWYKQQIKELNFNMRKVSQELDLVFLGSSNAVFPDEVLQTFEPKETMSTITMAYGEQLKLNQEIDPKRTYILGTDVAASTASSEKGDFSAIVLTDAQTGEEVGAWHGKYAVVKRLAVIVKSVIQGLTELHGLTEDTLIVVIERNSFGLGVVEDLIYDDGGFPYDAFLYRYTLSNGDKIPGMQTNSKSRDMMFNLLLSTINEMPERARSTLLQEELRNLEQHTNGKFAATNGAHDDVVMAYNFCLYVRHDMINEGLIETDGRVSKYDLKKATYFLDVTMTTADPGVHRFDDKSLVEVEYNDEKEDRKRILKEMGYDKNYDALPTLDNFVIGL